MNIKFDLECTPEEARAFLGLPDVRPLNDHVVEEIKNRMTANAAMLAPEELMKSWMSLGGQATEQFRKLMTAAVQGAGTSTPKA